MGAALRVATISDGEFLLRTRVTRRLTYAATAALLGAAMIVGLDPARDFAPDRAPWSLLYLVLMAGAMVGALADKVVVVEREPRTLVVTHRMAGRVYRTIRHPIPDGAVVRLKKEKRTLFVLEIGWADTPIVLDSSSSRVQLDVIGRSTALALDLPYEG